MFRQNLPTIPFLFVVLSAMFFIGLGCSPCQDPDNDGYGRDPRQVCPFEGVDCDDDTIADPPICFTCGCAEPECAVCASCINPGAIEVCSDGIDNDCDGLVDDQDDECPAQAGCIIDGFEGGEYSFTVTVAEISDECAGGIFNGLVDPGPYGPVALPATADLPQDITMTLPFVGEETGTLYSDGVALRLTVGEPIQGIPIQIPGFGSITVTASVSGTLCPMSATWVDAAFFVTIQSIQPSVPLVNPGCRIGVPATGTLQ